MRKRRERETATIFSSHTKVNHSRCIKRLFISISFCGHYPGQSVVAAYLLEMANLYSNENLDYLALVKQYTCSALEIYEDGEGKEDVLLLFPWLVPSST